MDDMATRQCARRRLGQRTEYRCTRLSARHEAPRTHLSEPVELGIRRLARVPLVPVLYRLKVGILRVQLVDVRCLRHGGRAREINTSRWRFSAKDYRPYEFMYELASIDSGSSGTATSKRLWICLSTSASSSLETKVIARPLVPKRPARPTRCRYESASGGVS